MRIRKYRNDPMTVFKEDHVEGGLILSIMILCRHLSTFFDWQPNLYTNIRALWPWIASNSVVKLLRTDDNSLPEHNGHELDFKSGKEHFGGLL